MNKFCSHCGREYDITAHFCPSCGCKNEAAPVQPQVQAVQPQVQAVQPQVQVVQSQVPPVQPQVPPVQPQVQVVQSQVQAVQPQAQVVQPQVQAVQPQVPPVQPQVQATQVQPAQPQVQIAPAQITQPQVQVSPVQVQPQVQAAPVQIQPTQPQVQTAPVSQPMQSGPASTVQPQPAMYGNNQTYIDASMYANAPAKPKKNHTWIIVVSVVGGLFLLLIILLVIFISLMLKSGTTANDILNNNTGSHRSLQELQDYYYADYKNADLNSSEFLDLNTEDTSNSGTVSTEDSSAASTESSSTVSVQSADFQDSDLTFINVANQDVLNLSADMAYLLQDGTPDRQTSLSQSTVSQYTDNIQGDAQYSLGREIAPGASLADFCNAYGINSSNSMLQVHSNDAWSYYYFSNPRTLSGLSADAICLTIGWSKKDDTWTRLNANSLQNYYSSAQDSSDDAVLFYTVTLNVPTDPDTVSADSIRLQTIQVEYGTPDAFYHFYGRNAAEN